ncbi:diguanylate cyclase [Christensenellaceae bacterium OttesenSCG-928-L17]|nr:diguanylate cyclase [Christensenellaceae bacterium OttesenSCG-928-L17]
MSNGARILLYLPLAIAQLIFIITLLPQAKKASMVKYSLWAAVCMLFWLVAQILFHVLRDDRALRFVYDLKIAFIGWFAFFAIRFLLCYCGNERFLANWVFKLLCVVPAVTTVLCLTTFLHPLLLKSFEIIAYEPLTMVVAQRGIWYFVHLTYCQLLAIAAAILTIYTPVIMPKAYRNGTDAMAVGVLLYWIGFVLETWNTSVQIPVDGTLYGAGVASIACYVVLAVRLKSSNLQVGREEIFNYIHEGIFILDAQGNLITANKGATAWMAQFRWRYAFPRLEDKLAYLQDTRQIHRRFTDGKSGEEEGGNEDIYVDYENYSLAYNKTTQPVENDRGQMIGQYVIMSDVTRNRILMDRLRQTAGVDELTGIANRYAYQENLRRLDQPEHLPLGLLVGDINDLKLINDQLGHHIGDIAIKTVAKALAFSAPEGAVVARTGGDEFALIVPKCTQAAMEEIINHANEWISCNHSLPQRPQVAMGYAIKTRSDENIFALIDVADKSMYANK